MRSSTRFSALIAATVVFLAATSNSASFARVLDGTMAYAPERQSVRCVFFGTQTVSGSYSIDYGAPEWRAEYDETFDDLTLGKRMRFGKDQWTAFDSSCALAFGKTEVKAGLYYCVLERSKKGDFSLVLLEAEEIRKSKLDPFASAQTKGGIAIALSHEKAGESATNLKVEIEKDAQNEKEQTIKISFGPHRLTARAKAKI